MNDENVIDLPGKFNIKELIRRTAEAKGREDAAAAPEAAEPDPDALPPLDGIAPLPAPGDAYKAYARPANQMQPTLHILLGDGRKCSFPYSGRVEGPHLLPGGDPGKGDAIVLRFSASVTVEVTLHGRHLDELHNYLGDHRIRWVRELANGKMVKGDGSPVITRVRVEQAKEWPPAGMG